MMNTSMSSSRGFGGLGSTKPSSHKVRDIEQELREAEKDDELSSDDEQKAPAGDPNEIKPCPNCHDKMPASEIAAHTVQCYRNSTKCKVCSKVILKDKKKEHLMHWRNLELLKQAIINDQCEQVSLHFDHGADCN